MVTHDMNLLAEWFKANQLSLNTSKTGNHKLDITIDGHCIPQVRQTHFLGVTLDDELSWHPHISQVREKLVLNKHLLQLGKNMLNTTSLLGIYHAHIYSHLMYSLNT